MKEKKKTTVIEEALQFKKGTNLNPRQCARKVRRPIFWGQSTFVVLTVLQVVSFVGFFQTNSIIDLVNMLIFTCCSVVVAAAVYFSVGRIKIGHRVWSMGLEYLQIADGLKQHGLRKVLKETSPEKVVNAIEDRLDEYARRIMQMQAEGVDTEKVDTFKKATFKDLFDLAKDLGVKPRDYSEFFPKEVPLMRSPFEGCQ